LFAIIGVLVLVDFVILIPPTAVPNAILRWEQEELEGEEVCKFILSVRKLIALFVGW